MRTNSIILLYKQTRLTTPKRGNKGFYKGKGAIKGGYITSKGKFIRDEKKMKLINAPKLDDFNLHPYVSHDVDTRKVNELIKNASKQVKNLNE